MRNIARSKAVYGMGIIAVIVLFYIVFLMPFLSSGTALADRNVSAGPCGYAVSYGLASDQKVPMLNDSGDFKRVSFFQVPLWIQVSALFSLGLASSLTVAPLVACRVKKSENHNKRAVLFYILSNPGCTAPELARERHMNIGTVRYHIRRLHEEGRIIMQKVGKFSRLYVSKSTYNEREKLVASSLRNDTNRVIISAIMEHPGINNMKLSEKLGLDRTMINRNLQKLLDDDIVTFEWEGKNKLYYITAEAKEPLVKLMPLNYQCPGLMKE